MTTESCGFCDVGQAKYTCPKCNKRYCSLDCYRNVAHEQCSEMFYQDWVTSTLRDQSVENPEKEKVLQMLKENYENIVEDSNVSTLEDRFSDVNLEDDIDVNEIWERLNEKEKTDFKNILKNEEELGKIVPIKKPWWNVEKLTLVFDTDNTEPVIDCMKCPPLPVNIKKLSMVTTVKPANTIPYNLCNILYGYAFLVKCYNNEIYEFIDEVINSVLLLCPVVSKSMNYMTLDECIQDNMRILTSSNFNISVADAKRVCCDVCAIIDGPENTQQNSYILCTLNDMKIWISHFYKLSKSRKSKVSKEMYSTLFRAIKKLDFFLSWTVEYYESHMKDLAIEIKNKFISELVTDFCIDNTCASSSTIPEESKKVLIEEIN